MPTATMCITITHRSTFSVLPYINKQTQAYDGLYIQPRMSCLNAGTIDEVLFTTELSKKFRTSIFRLVLNEWYYHIDYASNTTMYDQSVPSDGSYALRVWDANQRNDYFYDFNKNASEYYKGGENKLALYFTHDWDVTTPRSIFSMAARSRQLL